MDFLKKQLNIWQILLSYTELPTDFIRFIAVMHTIYFWGISFTCNVRLFLEILGEKKKTCRDLVVPSSDVAWLAKTADATFERTSCYVIFM